MLFEETMMKIIVIHDDINWLHSDPSGGHPENPYRLERLLDSLRSSIQPDLCEFSRTIDPLRKVLKNIHSDEYVDFIERECSKGFHYIDQDTYVTQHTFNIALRYSTTIWVYASKSFEENRLVLALPRPPGHHAGYSGRAMGAPTLGFCIFNHSAVADSALLEKTKPILHIDFDAHHGNGTQDIFWNDARVIHVDIHQHGLYPGTGWVDDIGGKDAKGSKINIPLPPYSGDAEFVWVVENIIKQLISTYRFEAIVVSAGFDSYVNDGLAELEFTEDSFTYIGNTLYEYYRKGVVKTIVSVLEGGYGRGLKYGFSGFIKALMGFKKINKRFVKPPPPKIYEKLRSILREYHGINIVE
ncbi:MAG: histone deacetylase family protein [Desulfurococcaceae archaeon]